jgi:hypothetical protein
MSDNNIRIKRSLNVFLDSKELLVAAINGEWGVGKTYFWKYEYISEYVKAREKDKNDFIYVSLFGLNSISELKNALLSNFPIKEISSSVSSKGSFGIKWIGDLAPLVLTLAFNAKIKNKIICIDDLERKGKNLKIKDIFGLVDILSNQRACKVVLIHNKSQLQKGEEKSYSNFKEKVIDIEIKYSPSYSTLAKIGFNDSEGPELGLVTKYIEESELRNIRVIKKAKRLLNDFNQKLDVLEVDENTPDLKENLLKLFMILCGCYYKSNKYKDYKKLLEFMTNGFEHIDFDLEKVAKEGHSFYLESEDLKLIPTDIVAAIDHYFENGFFPDDLLSKSIPILLSNYASDSASRKYSELYKKCYYNFEKNEKEFKEAMHALLKSDCHKLSFREFSSALDLLDYLQCDLNELRSDFCTHFEDEIKSWDLDEKLMGWDFKVNENLLCQIEKIISKNKPSLDIEHVLLNILKNRIHNDEELNFLLELDTDKIYNWIKHSQSTKLIGMIRGVLLKFNANKMPEKQIALNTIEALKKIASEDRFNKKKIETLFGITNKTDSEQISI